MSREEFEYKAAIAAMNGYISRNGFPASLEKKYVAQQCASMARYLAEQYFV